LAGLHQAERAHRAMEDELEDGMERRNGGREEKRKK